MAVSKKYSHDRLVLLLLSSSAFVGIANSIVTVVRLLNSNASIHLVQYRSNMGINRYQPGSILELYSFAAFSLLVVGMAFWLSYKIYPIRRHVALMVLGLSLLLLIFAAIVINVSLLGIQ